MIGAGMDGSADLFSSHEFILGNAEFSKIIKRIIEVLNNKNLEMIQQSVFGRVDYKIYVSNLIL